MHLSAPVPSQSLTPATGRDLLLLLRRASTSYSPTPTNATHLSNLNRLLLKTSYTIPKPQSINARLPEDPMSPRSLQHHHHLLSNPPNSSPRQSIAHRWHGLHGSDNWSSLLDPLDDDLRHELLRYGDHVQFAYESFHSHATTLPDTSYHIVRDLYATASISFPQWVDRRPPWLSQQTSWIGYVAVCDCPREIQRLGRRDIVVTLRGTATCLEWAENIRSVLVDVPDINSTHPIPPKVQCGFWSLFKTPSPDGGSSLADAVVDAIRCLVNAYDGEEISITVTGHSLGAALALLVADEVGACVPQAPPATVLTFGGPRLGNRGFADRVTARGVKVLRVVNEHDMVTRVPGVLVSEQVDMWLRGDGDAVVPREVLDAAATWGYWHVGSELRVDSRRSPYLKPNADPACCHDLEAYLHLVDGFMGSHCPFRANANRSILRLMSLQGSNMKKLYSNQAAAMGVRLDS